jgi:DNA-binding MarR family transcriptional regulator
MNEKKLQKQIKMVDEAFHRIWYRVLRQGAAQFDARLKISQIEMHIIGMVYEKPDLLLKDIRKRLDLPQTTLSSMVAKLEKMDLIKRVINRSDLRSFSLQITDKGRKLMQDHKRKDYEYTRNLLMALDDQERERFSRLFYKAARKVGESKL